MSAVINYFLCTEQLPHMYIFVFKDHMNALQPNAKLCIDKVYI